MNTEPSLSPLPSWPPGTVAVLVTAGDGPHAIPVSAAVRAGPAVIVIALAASRGSLSRLRVDPRVAVIVLAAGDVAFTARGRATVEDGELVDGVVAVRIDVEQVDAHNRPTFVIEAGVSWHWTDEAAASRDADVRAALARLVERI